MAISGSTGASDKGSGRGGGVAASGHLAAAPGELMLNAIRSLSATIIQRSGATEDRVAGQRTVVFPSVQREHLLLAAVVCVSWGAVINFGNLSVPSLLDIVAGLTLLGAALVAPRRTKPAARTWWIGAAICLAAANVLYMGFVPLAFAFALTVLLIAGVLATSVTTRAGLRIAAGSAAVAAVAGLLTLSWQWGHARIDVFAALRVATGALLAGHNPYTPTFRATFQTAPKVFVNIPIHFDYLPGAVLLAAPSGAIGDVRVSSVIASVALAAFALRVAKTSSPSRNRRLQVFALCVAMPLTVAMVLNAWLDVYSVAGFAGWLALRHDRRTAAIVCLVVALTVKPTLLLAVLPFWLWSGRARKDVSVAAAGAVAVILPFAAMTGFQDFFHDVVGVYGSLGFRYDGLTLSAWWYQLTGSLIPVAFTIAAGGVAAYLALRHRPTDTSQALITGAFLTTAAFLLAKQAFLNYYFIPAWLLILALAAGSTPIDTEGRFRLPAAVRMVTPSRSARRERRRNGSTPVLEVVPGAI